MTKQAMDPRLNQVRQAHYRPARAISRARRSLRTLILAAAIGCSSIAGGAFAQQPASQPAAAAPTTQTFPQGVAMLPGGRLRINFVDADINTVLNELSRVAGFSYTTKITPLVGRIPRMVNLYGVSRAEAVNLLNSALDQANYYAIMQDQALQIVYKEEGRQRVRVITAEKSTQLAATDELVTVIVPLRYASATQLRQDLQPLINPGADFTANASSNSLMMTDIQANIKRVVEIVEALDTHIADRTDVKVVSLKYATAADVARLINDLFRTQGGGGGGGGGAAGGQRGAQGGAGQRAGGGGVGGGGGARGGGAGGGGGRGGGGGGGGRSDVNVKENFGNVDPQETLAKVASLPITTWNYKDDTASRHLGPMAQDWYRTFGIGTDDKTITFLDEGGVALSAIQGLNQKLEQKDARINALEKELTELKALVQKLAEKSNQNGR